MTGKAYAEDLIHCINLRKHGLNIFIDPNIIVETFDTPLYTSSQILDFIRSRFSLYRSLRIHNVPFSPLLYVLFSVLYLCTRIYSAIFPVKRAHF